MMDEQEQDRLEPSGTLASAPSVVAERAGETWAGRRMPVSEIMVPVPISELFPLAASYEQAGRLEEADRLLNRILAVVPNQPDSLHMSGIVAFRLGRQQEAVEKMEKAIQFGVDIALYLRNICEVYRVLNRLDDALAAAKRSHQLAPNDPLCLHNLSVIHYERCEPDEAIAVANAAIMMRPDMPGPWFARGEAELLRGDWEKGWEDYEWRFKVAEGKKMLPTTDKPQWDGSAFDDTLLLVADQGFGDVIQFSRYIGWVTERCPNIVVAASREIAVVLRQLVPEDRIYFGLDSCPPYRAYIALSGLPRLHGTRVDNVPAPIPYLHADPAKVATWKQRLTRLVPGRMKKVGIVWAGRPTHNNDRRRSAKLADFAPLAAVPGVALVSLQKGPSADQAGRYFGRAPLINIGAEVRDYDDTMALIESLDLVVTVDTSVGHLAAAMGKPVWILLATSPDWRWLLQREDTPWYPTVRLFRQTEPRKWGDVFTRVAAAMDEFRKPTPG